MSDNMLITFIAILDTLAAYVLWENVFVGEDKDTKWRNVTTCRKFVTTFGVCLHKMVDMLRHVETCLKTYATKLETSQSFDDFIADNLTKTWSLGSQLHT